MSMRRPPYVRCIACPAPLGRLTAWIKEDAMGIVIKKNFKLKKPTFESVMQIAKMLGSESTPDKINTVIRRCAKAELGPVEESQIVNALHAATGVGKKPLKQQLDLTKFNEGLLPGDAGLAVARQVREEHFADGKHILRSSDGRFFCYSGTHWDPISQDDIRKLIIIPANNALASSGEKSLSTLVNKSLACFKDILGVDDGIGGHPDDMAAVINVLNGELWIDGDGTVKPRPHDPASRLTTCLPVQYNPEAKCPKFEKALLDIFAKSSDPQDMARHFMELFGYIIQPVRDIPHFALLIGQGANGKTKLLETIQKLLGPDATLNDSVARFTRDNFNLANLQGKLAFIDDDVSEGTVLDDGLIKKISEGKTVSARRAYGHDKVTFVCRALPIIAGNTYPKTRDISHGMARRALVIPFERVFKAAEQDMALFPGIWEEELPGILNLALAGLKRLRARGNQFGPPKDCIEAREEFFRHANPLVAFLHEQCAAEAGSKLRLTDMRVAIRAWATEQGVSKSDIDNNRLRRKLVGLGYEITEINGYPCAKDIKLI